MGPIRLIFLLIISATFAKPQPLNPGTFLRWGGGTWATNNCVKLNASGRLVSAGAACGSGSGSGITSLNALTGATQTFATGTTGTDFAISSSGTTHTFNIPTASAANRGLLGTADYASIFAHIASTANPHSVTKTQVSLGNVDNYATASQAEAEAGAATDKFMTPQRVAQAIDALAGTVTEVTAGTGITVANGTTTPLVSMDTAVIPFYSTGAGAPSANCTAGQAVYLDTTAKVYYFCSATNTWKRTSGDTYAGEDTGGDDTYAPTVAGFPAAYATGQTLILRTATANTGACTINVNAVGAKACKILNGTTDPTTGAVVATGISVWFYDAAADGAAGAWILHSNSLLNVTGTLPLANGGTNQTSWTASRCVQVNAGGTALESASDVCGSGGGSDPLASPEMFEDFDAGNITSGSVGRYSWTVGGGTTSRPAAEAGVPGIVRRATGASSGTNALLYAPSVINSGLLPAESFDITARIRLNQTDVNTNFRLGLQCDTSLLSNVPPNNGIYFEKLEGDTNWFGVTRATSSETRTDTSQAASTSFVKLRIRRVDASTIGFTVNATSEVTATATIPTAGCVYWMVISNSTTADKTVDIDYFRSTISGLSR